MVYMTTTTLQSPTIPGTAKSADGWQRRMARFRERRGFTSPMNQTATRALVATCTYNERENIQGLLEAIRSSVPDADVLVVDDGSPDGTGTLADEWAERDERVHVIHRAGKLGLGTAILEALRFAIKHDYDFMVNMDADFSHSPSDLPRLMDAMRSADVAIGSRYVPGGGVTGWGFKRHFMSSMINLYSRLLLGLRVRDCSGAFRCYRLSSMRLIDFDDIASRGYSWQEEFLYHCQRVGCRITEVPITFEDRRAGESKINLKEAWLALWILFVTGARRCLGLRRRRTPVDMR